MADETTTDPTSIETAKPTKTTVRDELAAARTRVTELELQLEVQARDHNAVVEQLKIIQARADAQGQRPEVRGINALERLAIATEANALLTLSTRSHTAGKGRVAEQYLERAIKLLTPEE